MGLITLFALAIAANANHIDDTEKHQSSNEDIRQFLMKTKKEVQQMDGEQLNGVKLLLRLVKKALVVKESMEKKKKKLSEIELQRKLLADLMIEFKKNSFNFNRTKNEVNKSVKKFQAGIVVIGRASVQELKILYKVVQTEMIKRETKLKSEMKLKRKSRATKKTTITSPSPAPSLTPSSLAPSSLAPSPAPSSLTPLQSTSEISKKST